MEVCLSGFNPDQKGILTAQLDILGMICKDELTFKTSVLVAKNVLSEKYKVLI